jgi:hypothetical protein
MTTETRRTNSEQVAICRADLAGAIAELEKKLDALDAEPLYRLPSVLEELRSACERATHNAGWLEEITTAKPDRPRSLELITRLPVRELAPMPAEAVAAIEEALEAGLDPAEIAAAAEAAFLEAMAEAYQESERRKTEAN